MSKQEIREEMKESKATRRSRRVSGASSETRSTETVEGGPDGDRRHRESDPLRRRDSIVTSRRCSEGSRKGKNYSRCDTRKGDRAQVPIVENPAAGAGTLQGRGSRQEIPAHLYRAVAEILAYIYRLMKGRLPAHDSSDQP